jgi:hypothetical protein
VLSKLGDRVEKGRIPFVHRLRRHKGKSRLWGAVLAAVLLALAVPAIGHPKQYERRVVAFLDHALLKATPESSHQKG